MKFLKVLNIILSEKLEKAILLFKNKYNKNLLLLFNHVFTNYFSFYAFKQIEIYFF